MDILKEKPIRVSDTESFIKKAISIHGEKFSYVKTVWENSKSKVIITCPTHGDFTVRAANHVTAKKPQGCRQCSTDRTKKSNEDYLADCRKQHGDLYDLSLVDYQGATKPVTIICREEGHGEFQPQAANFANGSGCPKCGDIKSITKRRTDLDQLIEEFNITHNNKYLYHDVHRDYSGLNDKIKISCPVDGHGIFEKVAKVHKEGQGCPMCSLGKQGISRRKTTQKYIDLCVEKYGDQFDYSDIDLSDGIGKNIITITCKLHNIQCTVSAKAHLNAGATNCAGCMGFSGISTEETEVSDFIKSCLPDDCKVNDSDNQTIKPKQLDIVIPERNIAFEYCGIYWHQEDKGKNKHYHLNKTKECNSKGIRLIHIFSDEWINKNEIVKSRIATILKADFIKKYNARSLQIKEVSPAQKKEFLNRTHIQGDCASAINIALVDKDEKIISLMTFGKSRFNKRYEYELIRFSSELNSVVRGAASRLFKYFIREYDPQSISSYSDLRWNTGNVYQSIGFDFVHNAAPNYFYFHRSDPHILQSRQKYQKHKLINVLDKFDPNLTETQNMKMNDYGRIWDCGNSLFEWHKSDIITK